jgi:hypothetical protein
VALLVDSLREAGAREQAAALVSRLSAAGMFGPFFKLQGLTDQFPFGREADGTSAPPWGWEDLDLWLVSDHGTVRRPRPWPTVGPPNPQGKSRQLPVQTSGAKLRSPAQRPGSSQSSLGQDNSCPFRA